MCNDIMGMPVAWHCHVHSVTFPASQRLFVTVAIVHSVALSARDTYLLINIRLYLHD